MMPPGLATAPFEGWQSGGSELGILHHKRRPGVVNAWWYVVRVFNVPIAVVQGCLVHCASPLDANLCRFLPIPGNSTVRLWVLTFARFPGLQMN